MAITIDQFLRDLTERELLSTEEAQTVRRQLSANIPDVAASKAGTDRAASVTVMTPASLVLCECLVQEKLRDDGHQLIFNAHRLCDDSAVTIHLLMPGNGVKPASRLNGTSAGEISTRPPAVTDVARHGEMVFFCCKPLEAETLEQLVLQNGPLPLELATETLLQTVRTLNRLEEQGMFLEDVSAELLLLDEEGQVHLTGGSPHPFLKGVSSAKTLYQSLGQLYGFLLSGQTEISPGTDFASLLSSTADETDEPRAQSAERVYDRLMNQDAASSYPSLGELIHDLACLQSGQALPAAAADRSKEWREPVSAKQSATHQSSRPAAGWLVAALVLVGAIVVTALFNALK